jgi:hypothetical protein
MRRTLAVAAVAATLLPLALSPLRASTIYPASPCRVYNDTSFIGIPGQCGTAFRARPRTLYLRAPRQLQYYFCPF